MNPLTAVSGFAGKLIRWQRRAGRRDLPWQGTRDPYRVWLSEIMLQQTRVATAAGYYERFLDRFPDVASLARSPLQEVLRLWAGLGYYARARNLHRAARVIVEDYGGALPRERRALESLPGVGRSTAAAIAVFAFGGREAILDGNVKRVLARCLALPGDPGEKRVERRLWETAEALLPQRSVEIYTQALMDLGATLCTRAAPACARCPVAADCVAYARRSVHRYPRARRQKVRPLRSTVMLVLMHEGRVLLEPRAPTGIWGGLWSLPELPDGGDALAYCANQFGCRVGVPRRLPRLRHGFTHFTLDIRPRVYPVMAVLARAAQRDGKWFYIDEAKRAGVPAPVTKILSQAGVAVI